MTTTPKPPAKPRKCKPHAEKKPRPKHNFSDADKERAFRQYMAGTTMRQISVNMGCALDTVRKWHRTRNWRFRKTEIEKSIKGSMHAEEVSRRLDATRIGRQQQDLYSKLLERSQHLAETSQDMADVTKGINIMKELLDLGERIYGKINYAPDTPNPQPQEQARGATMHSSMDEEVTQTLGTMRLTASPTPPIQGIAGGVVASAPAGDAPPPPSQAMQAQAEPAIPVPTPQAQPHPPAPTPPPPPAQQATPIQIRQVSAGQPGQFTPLPTGEDLMDSDLTPEEIAARERSQALLAQHHLPPGHPNRRANPP